MTLIDESNLIISTIEASTKGSIRALAIGAVPILQLGIVISISMLLVALPLRLLRRG